jgi:hypothetical protein
MAGTLRLPYRSCTSLHLSRNDRLQDQSLTSADRRTRSGMSGRFQSIRPARDGSCRSRAGPRGFPSGRGENYLPIPFSTLTSLRLESNFTVT